MTEEVIEEVKPDSEIEKLIKESRKYHDRAQEAERKLAEREAAEQAREEERMAQQQEWQQLAEARAAELEAIKPKLNAYEAEREAERDSLIEALPEDDRDIYGNLPLGALRAHVEKTKLKKSVPNVDNSAPGQIDTEGYISLPQLAKDKNKLDPVVYHRIRENILKKIR